MSFINMRFIRFGAYVSRRYGTRTALNREVFDLGLYYYSDNPDLTLMNQM